VRKILINGSEENVFKKTIKDPEPSLYQIRFCNILQLATDIIHQTSSYVEHPIFDLIRLLSLQIETQHIVKLISQGVEPAELFIERLMFADTLSNIDKNNIVDTLRASTNTYEISPVKIDLAKDPVLSSAWSCRKFVSRLTKIGENRPDGEWKQQRMNSAILYLPLGITQPYGGGQHSITDGVIKSSGSLQIHKIQAMHELYDFMFFDGGHYRKIQGRTIISRCQSFEFGCIFEIGRIIKENNILFKNIELSRISESVSF